MKSRIKKKEYAAIYRLLDMVSPIEGDCGEKCNAACCNCGGDGSSPDSSDFELGIYLLPGEEKLFTQKEDWLKWSVEYAEDYDFPASWFGKVYFVRCKTPPVCPRNMRPLQCRFFPLTPHFTQDRILTLIWSTSRLPYNCPLVEEKSVLNPSFIKATYTAWKRLIKDPLLYDLVEMDSRDREFMDAKITYVEIPRT